jgi:nitrile hydratase accessory protein
LNRSDAESRCLAQLPESCRLDDEPVFAEPWQAQAFALAVGLIQSGRISWRDWSATLGEEISRAAESGIADDGSGYYELWLNALERLVDSSGLAPADELAGLTEAWRDAYASTPHGQPVKLPD